MMTRQVAEDYPLPEEGWSAVPERNVLRFTMHGRTTEKAPVVEGWEPFFVAVSGTRFTTWTYRPVKEEETH